MEQLEYNFYALQRITAWNTLPMTFCSFQLEKSKKLMEPFQNKPLFLCWVFVPASYSSGKEVVILLKLDLIMFLIRYV